MGLGSLNLRAKIHTGFDFKVSPNLSKGDALRNRGVRFEGKPGIQPFVLGSNDSSSKLPASLSEFRLSHLDIRLNLASGVRVAWK